MLIVLTSKVPLRVAGPWKAEIVATDQHWQLSVAYFGEGHRELPRYYVYDGRRCLELIAAVKRAWRKIRLAKRMRKSSSTLKGIYDVSGGLVEIRPGLLGDYVRVFGVRLRTARDVRTFRRAMIASVRLGRKLQAELRGNRSRL